MQHRAAKVFPLIGLLLIALIISPLSLRAEWDFYDDKDFRVRYESSVKKHVQNLTKYNIDGSAIGHISTRKIAPDRVNYQVVMLKGYSEVGAVLSAKHAEGNLMLGNLKPFAVILQPNADGGESIIFTFKLDPSQMAAYDAGHKVTNRSSKTTLAVENPKDNIMV